MPEDFLIGGEPRVRAIGASADRNVMWLGIPSQPAPTLEIKTSGRKPVDLDKVPAYLRDVTRFRR